MISDLNTAVLQCSPSILHLGSLPSAPSLHSALFKCSGAWWAVSGGYATMEMFSQIQAVASQAFSFISFFSLPLSSPLAVLGRSGISRKEVQ